MITDEYSGDLADLTALFDPTGAGPPFPPNAHEHMAGDGGYYWHHHQGGQSAHEHERWLLPGEDRAPC